MIQGTSSPSKQSRQIRTSARGLRTSDPKRRTLNVREGTKGAEGKNKGNERKEIELKRRRIRKKKKEIRSAHTHWMKDTAHKPYPRQGQKDLISAYRKVVELLSAYTHCTLIDSVREDRDKQKFRSRGDKIIPSKRNLKRKSRKGSSDVFLLERTIELEID